MQFGIASPVAKKMFKILKIVWLQFEYDSLQTIFMMWANNFKSKYLDTCAVDAIVASIDRVFGKHAAKIQRVTPWVRYAFYEQF